ncbi:hypothetical protein TNCV_2581851 [Trichonephila clavipes]|nr:hypothetical protein TNCV_2581851 [Trichonephila clavipes]
MCLTAWLLLRWTDGAITTVREGCGSLCMDRITNEGRFDLSTFRSEYPTSILASTPRRSSSRGGYYWFI